MECVKNTVDQKTVRNKPSISDYFPNKAKKYFKSKIKNTEEYWFSK